MSSDPNKKSARTFQCRDALWETFEEMAEELECSVDYLISEAMKQYARQRGQGIRPPMSRPEPAAAEAPPSRGAAPLPPLPPPPAAPPSMPGRASVLPPLPPPPSGGRGPAPIQHAPPPPPPPSRAARAPLPPVAPPMPPPQAVAPQGAQLSAIYAGEKVLVSKEQFIIGRGKQSSDLTIRDPNISRQHAMVELTGGQYVMVDLGSTNGVEYNGQRISRKVIAEGDVFSICNHQIQFTYR